MSEKTPPATKGGPSIKAHPAVAPADPWSTVDELPPKLSREVHFSRRFELMAAIVDPSLDGGSAGLGSHLSMMDRLRDIDPQNAIEAMLAAQLIQTHVQAANAMRRANLAGDNVELREVFLRQFERLSLHFLKLAEGLDKRRGRGHQRVTVEHVNVEGGGRAILGNIHMNDRNSSRCRREGRSLSDGHDQRN